MSQEKAERHFVMEEDMETVKEKGGKKKLAEKLTKDNFLILLLAGILLLVIVWPVKDENKNENTAAKSSQWDSKEGIMDLQSDLSLNKSESTQMAGNEWYAYVSYLEDSLEGLLGTMDGVGRVKVMITLKNSGEAVVEKDKNTSRSNTTEVDSAGGSRNTADISNEEETVYEKSDTPYVTKRLAPTVEGVLVSAEGGGNDRTVQNITEAIQALFGVESHKIKVVKMNS